MITSLAAAEPGVASEMTDSDWAVALMLVVAGLAPMLWVFAVAWTVLGVNNGIVNVDVSTVLLNRTPDAARGRVLAGVNAMLRGSALGAMALGGALGTALGDRATFVAAGLLMLFRRNRAAATDHVARAAAPGAITSLSCSDSIAGRSRYRKHADARLGSRRYSGGGRSWQIRMT
jgi:MFS family permease